MNQDQRTLTEESTLYQIIEIAKGYDGTNYDKVINFKEIVTDNIE